MWMTVVWQIMHNLPFTISCSLVTLYYGQAGGQVGANGLQAKAHSTLLL